MKKFIKGQRGFTLIEIIIVLAILAILAALLVPHLVGWIARGHEASYDADKRVLELAVLAYYARDPLAPRWPTHGGVAPHLGAVGRPAPIPAPPADILPANRHGLINITRLVAGGFLAGPDAVRSAGVQQHPGLTPRPSTGSYIWYIADARGTVRSVFWDAAATPPAWRVVDGFQGVYP
ncbi:MAG: Type II secretion system protein G [Dehalococcoidia bacterium]|nr:Type II secretion system protein G [Chloroflexota bacterium]